MTTCNKCNAEGVTGGSTSCFEGFVELAVLLALGEVRRAACARAEDLSKVPGESVWQGDPEVLSGIGLFSLAVSEPHDPLLKVDGLGAELGLAEAAPEVGADLKDGEHPRCGVASCEGCASFFKVARVEVGLLCDGLPSDLGEAERVLLAQLAAEGFLHDEGKKLQLEAGGIVNHPLCCAPRHKVCGVLVTHVPRVSDASLAHEIAKSHPRGRVSFQTLRPLVVAGEVVENPSGEFAGIDRSDLGFLCAGDFCHAPSRAGLFGAIVPEPGGSLSPRACLKVSIPKDPVSTLRGFCGVSHAHRISHKLPHAPTKKKWLEVGQCCKSGVYVSERTLPLHHRAIYCLVFEALAGDSHMAPTNSCGVAAVQQRGIWS